MSGAATATSLLESKQPSHVTVATASLIGTAIEWYDFFLYGTAAALVFPKAFFPAGMPALVSLIASFSIFAVGFLARPIGGVATGAGRLPVQSTKRVTALREGLTTHSE